MTIISLLKKKINEKCFLKICSVGLVLVIIFGVVIDGAKVKRSYSDQSVRGYLTEVITHIDQSLIF